MKTELFLNIYKNKELYLQRKISLKDKAMFLGSSPEADVALPIQEMSAFQFLLLPPTDHEQSWRVFDESSEEVFLLTSETPHVQDLHPWNLEFVMEPGYQPEWTELKHEPQGDVLVLSFFREQKLYRRQYARLSAQLKLTWKGDEILVKRDEMRNRTEAWKFEKETETLEISLSNKSQLNFMQSIKHPLKAVGALMMLFVGIIFAVGFSTKEEHVMAEVKVDKVMIVKIPSNTTKKPVEQQSAQSVASNTQNNQQTRAASTLGRAFRRFTKGLEGVSLAPSRLAGGYAAGTLSTKLQGMKEGAGGDGKGDKIFNGAGTGSTMGRGIAGVKGIRLLEDEVESSGGLKKEVIAQYIKSYLGQIVQCFERELSISPDLTGKVVVNFTINGKGQVAKALIQKSQFDNSRFHGCITNKVSHWAFPVPDGGVNVVVNYPFLFRAQ
ncbi:MAG: AgmX/PglI C-terminal domain-containing protein [Bdellovibrionota bacterium]